MLKQLGGLAQQAGDQAVTERATKAKNEHEVGLKQMEIDARKDEHRAGLLTELVKNDQIVESMLGDKKQMSLSGNDADQLLGGGQAEKSIKADFGKVGQGQTPNPAAKDGIPTGDLGLPAGYTAIKKPAKGHDNWIKVDNSIVTEYPALKGIEGKEISTAQYLGLKRGKEIAGRYKGVMDDKLWARAVGLANNDMEFIQASMDGDEAKIAEIIDRKKRLVLKTGGRVGDKAGSGPRKELGSIIADAFEKGLGSQP